MANEDMAVPAGRLLGDKHELRFVAELFEPPYRDRIVRVLPTLFNMVELENRRGKKLGMEVGTARERVLIALLMYLYGVGAIDSPPSTSHELDVRVNHHPLSIKTKSTSGTSGVKLFWTVNWDRIDAFVASCQPSSHMMYVNILWGKQGKFALIPLDAQVQVLDRVGKNGYTKPPRRGTNPRGVEISA